MRKMPDIRKRIIHIDEKKLLLIIFAAAVLLRIGGNVAREEVFFHRPFLYFGNAHINKMRCDEVWYDSAARAFLNGKGVLSLDTDVISVKQLRLWIDIKKIDDRYYMHKHISPAYPLFLAFCYRMGGINTLSVFIPQLILGSLTCVLLYLLAKEIFSVRVAVLAGFAMAFYPDLVFFTNFVRVETLFIFFMILGFLLLLRGNSRGSVFLIYLSAVIFGLVSLTRATFIFFIPVLLIWQIFFAEKNKKICLKNSLLFFVIIFLVLAPWCTRNFLVFNKFTFITDEANDVLLLRPDLKENAISEFYYKSYDSFIVRTVLFIRDHLAEYAAASFKRFLVFWAPYTSVMRPLAKVYKTITWLVIFPLAFWGMVRSWKNNKGSGLLMMFVMYHCLLHAASFVDSGLTYRYPIQPFLCIFASYGFWAIYEKVKGEHENFIHNSVSKR